MIYSRPPVSMTVRSHLFPFRTQKLSSLVPKIVGWTRPVKIGRCRRFSSIRLLKPQSDGHAPLAQLVEQLTLNQWAQGSSPWRCTTQTALNRLIRRCFFVQEKGCTISVHPLRIVRIAWKQGADAAEPLPPLLLEKSTVGFDFLSDFRKKILNPFAFGAVGRKCFI